LSLKFILFSSKKALIKIEEREVGVRCTQRDVEMLKDLLPEALREFEEVMGRDRGEGGWSTPTVVINEREDFMLSTTKQFSYSLPKNHLLGFIVLEASFLWQIMGRLCVTTPSPRLLLSFIFLSFFHFSFIADWKSPQRSACLK